MGTPTRLWTAEALNLRIWQFLLLNFRLYWTFIECYEQHQVAERASRFNRIGLRAVSRHWPNGEVPYILEDDFDDDFRVRQLIMIVAPVSAEMFKVY